ncbi:porin family protein [Chromobacterium sp. Rain0013]|nr:porin family protein [Chromobacterium sp. Rain0013]
MSTCAICAQASDNGIYVFSNTGLNVSKLENEQISHKNLIVNDEYIPEIRALTFDNKSAGSIAELGAGYGFNKNFAIELSYAYLGEYKNKNKQEIRDENGELVKSSKETNRSIKLDAWRFAFLGAIPVSDTINLYGKLSLNQLKQRIRVENNSETSTLVKPGIGLGVYYKLTKNFNVRAEYEYTPVGDVKIDLFKIGVAYKF